MFVSILSSETIILSLIQCDAIVTDAIDFSTSSVYMTHTTQACRLSTDKAASKVLETLPTTPSWGGTTT